MLFRSAGEKKVDYSARIWEDHDESLGTYDSFKDDDDYAEGFTWSCCQEEGDAEGCKSTKHKTNANIVGGGVVTAEQASRKRRAEEEITRPRYARCENCEKRYDLNENDHRVCTYHPGMSSVLPRIGPFDAS